MKEKKLKKSKKVLTFIRIYDKIYIDKEKEIRKMKVREIITVKEWENNNGWIYEQEYSNEVIEVSDNFMKQSKDEFFANFEWEKEEKEEHDLRITVEFFRENYDPLFDDDAPLVEYEVWESEL